MTKKMRNLIKILMFISSYCPLYFMLLILHYSKYDSIEKLCRPKAIIFVLVLCTCIIISLFSVAFLVVSSGRKPLSLNEIERPDDTIISYMMTYIIPILTTDMMNRGEILVNVILFLLIGYLYIRLNLIYLNPLWSMFGYLSYRINSDKILITNIGYADLKTFSSSKKELQGLFIANDIFLAKKKDNQLH